MAMRCFSSAQSLIKSSSQVYGRITLVRHVYSVARLHAFIPHIEACNTSPDDHTWWRFSQGACGEAEAKRAVLTHKRVPPRQHHFAIRSPSFVALALF